MHRDTGRQRKVEKEGERGGARGLTSLPGLPGNPDLAWR